MIAWAVDTLIGTTLIMLLVLAVRRPVAHFFGAFWAYALWLLPLLRFVLPPLDLFDAAMPVAQQTIIIVPAVVAAAAPAASGEASTDWILLLLALWAGGAAVFISWHHAAYGALMLSLGRNGRRARPGEYGGIPVIESESADGPMAVGFLNRRIVVPLDFDSRYSAAERSLALDHELVHHRRGDIWWNLAAVAVLTLNWFNPIAHIAFRAFRADQELACDAAVASEITIGARCDYARALVKSASRPGQIATCPLYHVDQLKRRLKMMKEHRRSMGRTLGGGAALAASVVAGVAVGSPGLAQEERAAPRVLIAQAGQPEPIISDRDIATLREKCGDGGAMVRSDDGTRERTVICSNGKEVDDPEVREIVRKTVKRAQERVVEVDKQIDHAKIAEAVARAQADVRHIDVEKHMKQARRAMEIAKLRIKGIDIDGARFAAIAPLPPIPPIPAIPPIPHVAPVPHVGAVPFVHPAPRVRVVQGHELSAEERAEIEEALAEARESLAEARVDRAELLRELREAAEEQRRAFREADAERREALRELERELEREGKAAE